jgi:hypothetical protein
MYYYVAKELLLYETVKLNSVTQRYKSLTSSINIFDKVNKKWTKFEEGTILKAIKLDDVDYLKKKNSCYQLICCQFDAKNRFELAIEFKVVDNFNELIAKDSSNIIDTNSKKKSFYLPVDTVDNSDIDIIPIETCINKHFKLNSLQMIRNFSKLNLNENLIYLKLFSQNIFFNNNNNNNTKTKNENENNEVKAASIFQLCEFKESCDIICGYLLKEKKFFFAPIKCKLMNSKSIKITKIDDIDTNNELFTNFYNKLNEFKLNADQKIKQFDLELNKLETFHHTDENDVQFNLKKKKPSIKKAKIIHFSDLANIGRSFSSDTLNLKSNDLNNANNNNNNNNSIKNQNNSNNKQQIRFKRNRYYSFKTKEKSKPTNTQQDDEIKPPIIESEMHNLRRSKSVDILN